MYYLMLTASVIMFSTQFFFNDIYVKKAGDSRAATYVFLLGSGIVGLIALLIIGGLNFAATPFTLLIAAISAVNSILCCICGMKALSRINLSLFSLFNMLGGMALPFAAGILFFDEPVTLAKSLCLAFIAVSMCFMFEKDNQKGGTLYYIGIFVFNGMNGVIAKIYQAGDFAKTDETAYSVWCILFGILIAAVLLARQKVKKVNLTPLTITMMGGYGILNKVANLLLLFALANLPASVQYPFITGGVIIGSTLFAYLTPAQPGRKELIATALSFAGIIFLITIPI